MKMKALRNRGCPHTQRPYVAKIRDPLFSTTLILEKTGRANPMMAKVQRPYVAKNGISVVFNNVDLGKTGPANSKVMPK